MKTTLVNELKKRFGEPTRITKKVIAWDHLRPQFGVVVEINQPAARNRANLWAPYPEGKGLMPEFALEYAGESGRHSNTYAAEGLKRGLPALKLIISDEKELAEAMQYVVEQVRGIPAAESAAPYFSNTKPSAGSWLFSLRQAWKKFIERCSGRDPITGPSPTPVKFPVKRQAFESATPSAHEPVIRVDTTVMPPVKPAAPRREPIPKAVRIEIWQRDGGKCVDCGTKESLCFDHIIPFSRGGSNTARNLQLLCERCNLAKGKRI
jgi:HNH endonuclease